MNDLPYRQGANAIIIDRNGLFLLVQKKNYGENQWDFPGGGIKEGENPQEGVLRELEEELGISEFEFIKKSPYSHIFEWPKKDREWAFKKHGKWWRGQEKHQYIFKFTGKKEKITPQKGEIRKIKWVPYEALKKHLVFEGQWPNAEKVLKEAEIN